MTDRRIPPLRDLSDRERADVSQVEHLWCTDDVPRGWPALEDLRVVPEIPLKRL